MPNPRKPLRHFYFFKLLFVSNNSYLLANSKRSAKEVDIN